MVSLEDALEKHFITELQTPQHKDNLVNFLKKEIYIRFEPELRS